MCVWSSIWNKFPFRFNLKLNWNCLFWITYNGIDLDTKYQSAELRDVRSTRPSASAHTCSKTWYICSSCIPTSGWWNSCFTKVSEHSTSYPLQYIEGCWYSSRLSEYSQHPQLIQKLCVWTGVGVCACVWGGRGYRSEYFYQLATSINGSLLITQADCQLQLETRNSKVVGGMWVCVWGLWEGVLN